MERQTLVLLTLLAGAIAGPISQDKGQCAKTCTESTRFNYETGKTYEFSYKADTLTTLTGAAEEHSSLHIQAIADVETHAPCDFVLKLREVQLEESDPRDLTKRTLVENSASFARALEASPLSFAFQDGRVETLCAAVDEPAWVLNIKRGILSAFQNNMPEAEGTHTVKETDVAGNCEAEYTVTENDGTSMTVKRNKNLLGCTERNNHVTAFQATPYKVESAVQSLPLMKSNHECVQTMNGGVLQSAECTEKHVFRPFSNNDNGAATHSVQKMELRRHHHTKHQGHHGSTRRTNMLYEHTKSAEGELMERSRAVATLQQICAHEDIRPHSAQLFSQLTYNLRELDSMSLSELHNQLHQNRLCSSNHQQARKFFGDAIPMVGTTAAVSLMRDLVMSGEVTGLEADQWLSSLAFVAKPNADMIREIRPLLESPKPTANMLLAVTALTRTFCRTSGTCAENMDVQDMVRILSTNLRTHCNGDRDRVLMSLKALGNLGQGQLVTTLARCAAADSNPIDIRVAAMAASRSMPCSQSRRVFLDTFADSEQDAEVRINAYLASMACPNRDVISMVKRMLEKEEVNQVGSFVWTHLTNLQETNDPFKKEIKDIINDETLQKEFEMDKRKFSRNYEGSMFFDSINTGAKMESNLIWSSKSYVPRSAMMNLTVDLFGHSVNLMEMGGRVEGVEHLIESLFGPEGYFQENAISTALKRARRSTNDAKLNRVEDRFSAEAENSPRGSVYMKIFGNELRYADLDASTMTSPADNFNLLELLLKLSRNQEADYSKSFMFLDSTITVPTIVGVPMKLSVNGTATVKLAVGGKMDLRQAAGSPRTLNIDGYVKPSGAVEVSSMMSVDAFVARTGLKMVSTLHTSNELNGLLSIQDSQVVLAKVNMPRDKIEVVSVESKFFVVHREVEREQKMLTEGRYTKALCTGVTLKKTMGVEVCGELEFPRSSAAGAPSFPLTGPAGFKVFINKADTHSAYEFEARLQTIRERHSSPIQSQVARLSFNTPGSKVNRELFTDVIINHMDKSLNANLRSPWKKAVMNGAVVNADNHKRAALTMTVDDTHEYSINSDVKINQRGKKLVLTPTLEVSLAGIPTMSARGNARVVPGDLANGEITVQNVFRKPVTVRGGYDKEVRKNGLVRYTSNMEIRTDSPLVKATASVDQRNGMKRTSIDVIYRLAGPRHRLRFNGQMKDAQSKQQYTVVMTGDMSSTQFPFLEHKLNLNLKKQPRGVDINANLRYGDDDKTDVRRIVLSHESNMRNKPRLFSMNHNTKFTWKAMDINVDSKINHKHSADEVNSKALVVYAPGKKIDLDIQLNKQTTSPLLMVADVSLSYPGRQMALHEKLQQKVSGYTHEMALQWQRGSRLTSQGELIISPNNKYDLRLEVNPPRMPAMVLTTQTSLNTDDFATKAVVEYSGARYSGETSWKYTMMESANAKIDIQCPSRQVTVTSMVSATGGVYQHDTTVMWDAKRDASKKMQINAVVKDNNNQMEGDFNLIYPNRKYNMAFNSQKKDGGIVSHGEVTWASGKTASIDTTAKFIRQGQNAFVLEGSAKFSSPIKYMENLMVSVNGNSNDNMYNNNMMVSWAEGQAINTVFNAKKLAGWKNFESALTIASPFSDRINADLNINSLDDQVTIHTEGSIGGGQKIELDFSGSNNYPSSVEVSVSAKTPFGSARRIGGSLRHSLRNGQLSNNVNGFINNKKIELALNGKDLSGSSYRDASIDVLLKTPFENFKQVSGQIKHSKNGNKFSNSLEASLGRKKISGAFDFVHQVNSEMIINNGNIRITTPFTEAENLFANWVHDIRSSNVKINYDIGANSQHMKLDFTHLNSGSSQVATHLKIETPFQNLRNLIIDGQKSSNDENAKVSLSVSKNSAALLTVSSDMKLINRDFAGQVEIKVLDKSFSTSASLQANTSPYTGHVDFTWNKNSKISLSGDIAKSNNQIRGNLRFDSPFDGYKRLMMTMERAASNDRHTGIMSVEYGDNKKIEIDSMIDYNQGIAYSLAVKSPCQYIKTLNIQGTHKRQLNKMNVAYLGENHRMVIESNIHGDSIEDLSMDAKFTSSMTEDITLNFVNKKVGSEWHTDADLQFARLQKVEVQTVLSVAPGMKFDLGIKTPFYQFKNMRTSFLHSGEGARFQSKMSFNMVAGGEKSEFASTAVVNGLQRINANVRINSPRIDSIDLTLNHNMVAGNLHTDITFGPSKKIDILLKNGDGKLSFAVETPFAIMTNLDLNAEHQVSDTQNSKFDLSMTTYAQTGKLSGHWNIKDMDFLDALLMAETPENTITLLAKHRQISEQWVTTVALSYSPEKTIAMEMHYNPAEQEATLSFNSPFEGFKDLHLLGAAKSRNNMKYGKVQFTNGDQEIMTEVRIRHGKKMLLDLKVETPSTYMKSMTFKTGMSGSIDDFKVNAEFDHNMLSKKIDFEAAVKAALDDIDTLITFTSPFSGIENMKFQLNHKEQGSGRYISSVDASYATNKNIQLRSQLSLHSLNHLQGQITLTSPCPILRSMQMAFNHEGDLNDLKTHIEVQINDGKKSELDVSFQADQSIRASVKAVTPLRAVGDVDFNIYHNGPLSDFETRSSLKYNNQLITASANFNTASGAQGKFVLDTPFTQGLTISVDHKGDLLNFKHNSQVQYGTKNVHLTGAASINSNVNVQFELNTPFAAARKTGMVVSYKGTITNFNAGLRMFLNQNAIDTKITLSAEKSINAEFKMQTPFEPVTDISLQLSHSGGIHAFSSKAVLNYAPEKTIVAATSFNMVDDIHMDIHIQTPCEKMRDILINFDFKNTANGWNSDAFASLNSNKLIEFKNVFKNGPSFEFSSVLVSKYELLKNISLNVIHVPGNKAGNTEVVLSVNGVVIHFDLALKNTAQKQIVLNFQSPIPHANDVSLSASADVNDNGIYAAVEFNSDDFKGVKAEAEYKVAPEVSGRFNIETPFKYMEKHTGAFTYVGSFPDFRAHAELDLKHVGKMQVDGDLVTSPAVIGEIKLTTPFTNAKEYSISIKHEGPSNNFKSDLKVASQEHFTVESKVNLKIGYESAGSFVFTSDVAAIKDFSISFNHQGNMDNFVSHAEATCSGCGKIEVDAKLSDTKAEFEIQTPFTNMKKYSVVASFDGPVDNFRSSIIIASQEHFKVEGSEYLKLGQQSAGSISFVSDINAIKDFSASFNHDGTFTNFISHAEATCSGCGKIEIDAKLTDTQAEFVLQTPFTNMKKYSVAASLTGPMNDIRSNIVVASKEHFKAEGQANLKLGHQSAGSISFKSDIVYIKDFSASFSKTGDKNQFTAHVEATCAGCGKIQVDSDFAASPLRGEFKLQTPFKNMKEYAIIFRHDGPKNNFKSMINVASQEHFNMEVNVNLKSVGGLVGGVSFVSDINAIKDFSASFSHLFSHGQFRSHAEAACSGCGKIELDGDFSLSPTIRGEFKFESPIKNMKLYTLSFNHEGDLKNFNSRTEIKSREHFTITMNGNLKTVNGLEGAFAFKSNLNAINDFNVAFDHSGNMQEFRSHVEFNCEEWGSVSADGDFRSVPSVVGNFHLKTPMPGMENFKLNIKHQGPINNFKSSAEFDYGYNRAIKGSIDAKTITSIEINMKLETPFSDDLEVNFNHNGEIRKFSGSATLLKKNENMFHYEISYDSTSAVQGSLKIQTPYMQRDFQISFKGEANRGIFKGKTDVSYGNQVLNTMVELKTQNGMEATFKMNTPWQQVENVEIDMTHKSWRRRMLTELFVKHNDQKYEGKFNLKFKPNIDGEITMKTPFSQARDVSIIFNHQGDLSDFEQGIIVNRNGQQKLNGKINFKLLPRMQASISYQSVYPMLKQLHATIGYSGNADQFNTHATISHNGQQKFQGQLDVQTYPSLQAQMKFQTPFAAARDVSATFNHDGSLRRFHTQGVINHNGRRIFNGDATFTVEPTINGEMKISTPGNNILAVLSHDKSLWGFKSLASVTHNSEKKFNTEVTFSTQDTIRGNLNMHTPYSIFRDVEASFSIEGSAHELTTVASISHNGEEKLNTRLALKNSPSLEAEFSLNNQLISNFRQFSAQVSKSGSMRNFVTSAKAMYNGQQALDAEVSFETSPVLKVNFKFETPHTKLQDAGINVKYQGHMMDFVVDASAQYQGEKHFSTLVMFKVDGNTMKTKFSLNTPFNEDLTVVYNHAGTPQNFQCHAEFNLHKADLTFVMSKGAVAVTLRTTMSIVDFTADLKYSMNNIKAELQCVLGKFEVEGTYKQKPMTLSINVMTPFEQAREVTIDMSHRGNRRAMFSSVDMKRNGNNVVSLSADFKSYARTIGNLHFKSIIPYMEKIAASFRHEMSSKGLKSQASAAYYNKEVSTEINIKFEPKIAGTIVLETPIKGYKKTSLKFSHTYQQNLVNAEATLKCGPGKEFSINGNFERKPTSMDMSFDLNTPFRAVKSAGASMKVEGSWENMKSSSEVYLNQKVIKMEKIYREENGKPVEASIVLTTPFTQWERTSVDMINTVQGTRQQPRIVFTWNKEQIVISGEFNKQRQSIEGHVTLNTPFAVLSEITLSGNANMNAAVQQVIYNGQKVLHTKVTYKNVGSKYNAGFTMITPHPMNTEVEFAGAPLDFTAKASLHWDTRNANKKIATEITHKLEGAKRIMGIRTITTRRITGLKTEIEHSASRFINKVELIWDEANDKKVSYEVSVIAKPTRTYRIYETYARLNTPIRSFEVSLNHKDNRQVYETSLNTKWDAARDTSRQLTLNNRYENTGSKHMHQLIVSHPKMAKDIVLRNEWTMNVNDIIYSGRTEIEYTEDASDTLIMSTLVQDQSGNYSVELGLSHPQSKLDVKMNSHLVNTPSTFSAGMGVNYMNARRKVNNLSLRGEIEKIRQQLTMELLTPLKKFQLNGKVKEKQNMYSVNVVATEDEDNQVSAKLNLDTEAQTVDMKAFYSAKNPRNMMHVYGKYIDGSSLVMEATRHHNGLQVVEGQVSMDLKEKHLLHSKVYWRPDALEEAKFATKKAIKQARQDMTMLLKKMEKGMNKEQRAKMYDIRRALPNMKPVSAYLTEEAHSLSRDVRVTKAAASHMFNNNEFYVRTAYRSSVRQIAALRSALHEVRQTLAEYAIAINQALEAFSNRVAVVAADVAQKCTEVCDIATAKLANVTLIAKRALLKVVARYEELYAIAYEKYMAIRAKVLAEVDRIVEIVLNKALIYGKQAWTIASDIAVKTQAKIDEAIAKLMANPRVQRIISRLNTMATKATDYMAAVTARLSELLSQVSVQTINNVHASVSMHLRTMTDALARRADNFLEAASQTFTDMQNFISTYVRNAVEHENSEYVRQYMRMALGKMSAAYTKYDVEARTKDFVRDVVTGTVNFVKTNVYYLLNTYLRLEDTKIIEWNPSGGSMEVQAYIPMETPNLQLVNFVNLPSVYRRVKAEVTGLVPDFDYSPMDTYYKYKPSSDVSNWIPPFKAAATLSGRQHYITFDGKHYEFAAPCSYLLARDFIDGNFSMVVNYDGVRHGVSKRSVIVTTGGKDVEIFTDGKVTVDNEAIALPSSWASTDLTLEEDILKVTDKKGITVVCDLAHDSCTLHVSGWYFGKMAGLFGTYNNEQSDDFTTAEGTKVASMSQFAASWAVGRRCPRSRNMARITPTASSQICSKVFHDKNSPLRPCFKIVDPVHFEAMCVNDVMSSEGAECNIASLYVSECRRQEVPLSLPESCQKAPEVADEQFMQDLEEYVGQKM